MFASHDALECPGERHVCVVVHPIRAKTELASGFRDAGPEPLLRVGKTERLVLGDEGPVDVVDVLGALAVGERGVEDHDGAAVHDEADLAAEGAVQPLGEIGECLLEHLERQRNVVHFMQSRNDGRMCLWKVDVLVLAAPAAAQRRSWTRAHARGIRRSPASLLAIRVRVGESIESNFGTGE